MTETEWVGCTDPRPMLRSLIQRWRAQERQRRAVNFERLRLFACACCRRVWDLLDDDHHKAVDMIEDYARAPTPAGLRTARTVRWAAGNRAGAEYDRLSRTSPRDRRACLSAWARNVAASAVWQAASKKPTTAANCYAEAAQAVDSVRRAQGLTAGGPDPGRVGYALPPGEELAAQAALLRDIVGNPFRQVSLDPCWLTSPVQGVARGIYEEWTCDSLPVLADALEEAGCTDREVLEHCRAPGPHVRGCWVIDLVLGRA
jgi:hypothetical protein